MLRASIALMLLLASAAARAQDLPLARSIGMADSMSAVATGNDALFLNPAAMALSQRYAFAASYLHDGLDAEHLGSLSIVDSRTSVIAGGVGFNYLHAAPDPGTGTRARDGWVGRVGAAYDYKMLAIGVTARWLKITAPAVKGGAAAYDNLAFTTDVGVVLGGSSWRISALGEGLIDTGLPEAPRRFGAGAAIVAAGFTLSAEAKEDATAFAAGKAPVLGFAAEYVLGDAVPIRAGYRFDLSDPNAPKVLAFGLGLASPDFFFDLGVQTHIGGAPDVMICLTLGVVMPTE